MDKRRGWDEIVAEILNIALEGTRKTHIMYRAKLSYTQANKYLSLLVEKGFLENMKTEKPGQSTFYKTTTNGLKFLENLESIGMLLTRDEHRV